MAGLLLYAVFLFIFSSLPSPEISLSLHGESERSTAFSESIDPESRVDLNTASREKLMTLPGIGEKTADAILALREQLGAFRYPEDLLLVNGIGAKKLDTIYDLIYIESNP